MSYFLQFEKYVPCIVIIYNVFVEGVKMQSIKSAMIIITLVFSIGINYKREIDSHQLVVSNFALNSLLHATSDKVPRKFARETK